MIEPLRIGVPGGVGDIHWTAMFLEDLKALHPGRPLHVIVSDHYPRRGVPYVGLLPFVDFACYDGWPIVLERWHRRGVVYGNKTLDYAICLNRPLEAGRRIESVLPFKINFNMKINLALDALPYASLIKELAGGKLAVVYMSSKAVNEWWLTGQWTEDDWLGVLRGLKDIVSRIVVVGANFSENQMWDDQYRDHVLRLDDRSLLASLLERDPSLAPHILNLIGMTTLSQVLGIIAASDVFVAMPSGLAVLAAHFKKATVGLWPVRGISNSKQDFHPDFPKCWVEPEFLSSGKWIPLVIGQARPNDVLAHCEKFLR